MTDIERPWEQRADSRELQRVEHAVARIFAETDRPVEVYAAVLEAIGRSLGWGIGAVWEVGGDGRLRCVQMAPLDAEFLCIHPVKTAA